MVMDMREFMLLVLFWFVGTVLQKTMSAQNIVPLIFSFARISL